MVAPRWDIVVEKGTKYYQEFQVTVDALGKSLVGKKIEVYFKSSTATKTNMFVLTEDNGGVIVVDDPNGGFAMQLEADVTNVDVDYGIYFVVAVDEAFPTTERDPVINGKVEYRKGAG